MRKLVERLKNLSLHEKSLIDLCKNEELVEIGYETWIRKGQERGVFYMFVGKYKLHSSSINMIQDIDYYLKKEKNSLRGYFSQKKWGQKKIKIKDNS